MQISNSLNTVSTNVYYSTGWMGSEVQNILKQTNHLEKIVQVDPITFDFSST